MKLRETVSLIITIVLVFIVAIIFVKADSILTNEIDAKRALSAQGFTNVRVTGYNFFACSKDDWYHTGFVATNPQGRTVTGTVCSGLIFKNATVRF